MTPPEFVPTNLPASQRKVLRDQPKNVKVIKDRFHHTNGKIERFRNRQRVSYAISETGIPCIKPLVETVEIN